MVQRGVVVPDGEHVVVFKYVPRLIYASMALSGIILVGMLFVLLKRKKHLIKEDTESTKNKRKQKKERKSKR